MEEKKWIKTELETGKEIWLFVRFIVTLCLHNKKTGT